MQFDQITYEVKDKTAIVTLNRPEKRNALSAQAAARTARGAAGGR